MIAARCYWSHTVLHYKAEWKAQTLPQKATYFPFEALNCCDWNCSSQLMPQGSGRDGLVVLGELGFQVFVVLGGSKVFQTRVKEPLQSHECLLCDGREWLFQRVRKGICHPPFRSSAPWTFTLWTCTSPRL